MKNISHLTKVIVLFIVSLWAFSCTKMGVDKSKEDFDLAIQNVQVFNSQTKTVTPNQTILINADTIAAIRPSAKKVKAKEIINGNGRLITPGFVDTHIHLQQMLRLSRGNGPETIDDSYRKKLAEKCLPYGTTTAIDMGQPEAWLPVTTKWQNNPSPDYPNYYVLGGSLITERGGRGVPQHHVEVTAAEAEQKIQDYKDLGIKNIKLYWRLNEPEMRAIIAEAKKEKMGMYAHVDHNIITIPQAMDMGVRHFEHFFTVTPSVLKYNEHWDKMNAKYNIPQSDGHIDDFSIAMTYFFKYIKETPDIEAQLMALLDRFAQEKVSISTAAHVLGAAAGKTEFFSSFSHFPVRDKVRHDTFTKQHIKEMQEAFDNLMQYMKVAHEKGVNIRIGTDNREAGRAMISEMKLLAKAGFAIEDVLQIATWNGATAMNIQDQVGSIDVGKKADLVLFEKDPFDDHENFSSTKTVIKGGKRYVPRSSAAAQLAGKVKTEDIGAITSWLAENKNNIEPFEIVQNAYVLLQSNHIDKAFAFFDLTKKLYPSFNPLYYEDIFNDAGYEYLEKESYSAAINVFEQNVAQFPTSGNAYDSAAEAYMANGQTQKAIEYYKKAAQLDEENLGALKQLKKLQSPNYEATRNKPSIAAELLKRMKTNGTDQAMAWFNDAKNTLDYRLYEDEMTNAAYDALGEGLIVEALEILKLNVQAFPNSTFVFEEETMYSVASQLMDLKMNKEALDYLSLNAQVFSNSSKAHKMLGDANVQLGNKDLAIANYEKSLELNSKNVSAIEALKTLVN